jgi:hypothetical protein
MRLTTIAAALAFAGALGLVAAPADAAPRHKRTYGHHDGTVFVTRDEDGKTRTRIIIQKRSYLDPGTEPLPSDRSQLDYIQTPNQRPDDVLDNTAYGGSSQSALPGAWTLSGPRNPWLDFNW